MIYFAGNETEVQRGEEKFSITQLVTVRARVRPQSSWSSVQSFSTTAFMNVGSINLGKRRILSKNPWEEVHLQPDLLWRPLKSLTEIFLVPLQTKFNSSYPWELSAQTWRSRGFREELLKMFIAILSLNAHLGIPRNIKERYQTPVPENSCLALEKQRKVTKKSSLVWCADEGQAYVFSGIKREDER